MAGSHRLPSRSEDQLEMRRARAERERIVAVGMEEERTLLEDVIMPLERKLAEVERISRTSDDVDNSEIDVKGTPVTGNEDDLQNTYDELERVVNEFGYKSMAFARAVRDMNVKNRHKLQAIQSMVSDKDDVKKEIRQLQDAKHAHQKEFDDVQGNLLELRAQRDKAAEELSKLNSETSSSNESAQQALKHQNEMETVTPLEARTIELQSKIAELEDRAEIVNEEVAKTGEVLEQKRQKLRAAIAELEDFQRKMAAIQARLHSLEQQENARRARLSHIENAEHFLPTHELDQERTSAAQERAGIAKSNIKAAEKRIAESETAAQTNERLQSDFQQLNIDSTD